jgi:hypothetical protein
MMLTSLHLRLILSQKLQHLHLSQSLLLFQNLKLL